MNILTKKFKKHVRAGKVIRDKNLINVMLKEKIAIRSALRYATFEELEYSYEDFLNDEKAADSIESKIIYNIHQRGFKTLKDYAAHIECDAYKLTAALRKGFLKANRNLLNSTTKFIEVVELDYNLEKFEVKFYKNHVELFGDKNELENFRKKFEIEYPVRWEPILKKWHLAFNGLMFHHIKYNLKIKED